MAKKTINFGNKKQVSAFIENLDQELHRIKLLKYRFEQKRLQVPQQIRDRYAGEQALNLISKTADSKLLAHARNLGFSSKINESYAIVGQKSRSILRQASDYIRMWLEFDYHMDLMIKSSENPAKNVKRKLEYDYYEHLSQ